MVGSFTRKRGHEVGRAPTEDNLLVLYWDRRGKTFEDIDGYRVVLQQSAWD